MDIQCDELDWYDTIRICSTCGGDVHSHFGDENADGDYWLRYHCHTCGKDYSADDWDELKRN